MPTPEWILEREGRTLPTPHPVVATLAMTVRAGSLLFVSGHGPFVDGRPAHTGKLGVDVTIEGGQEAAETVIMNLLGTLRAELGELSRISRFVKLLVFVNASSDFAHHHLVADGRPTCSSGLRRIIDRYPIIGHNLVRYLTDRLGASEREREITAIRSMEQRMADCLS